MSSLRSRLPEDTGYWDDLAGRITADADPFLQEYHARRGVWWSSLARQCPVLVAAALIGATVVVLALGGGPERARAATISPVVQAIEPEDALARRFLTAEAPPAVEILLPMMTGSGRTP
jgi:hypothetical protein